MEENDIIYLNGNWKIELEIPEVMQNRKDCIYKVISSDNKDIEVLSANVDETDFEMNIRIKNIEHKNYPKELGEIEEEALKENGTYNIELTKEGLLKFYGSEELVKLYENYMVDSFMLLNERNINAYYWLNSMTPSKLIDSNGIEYDTELVNGAFKSNTTYDENGFSNTTFENEYEGTIRSVVSKYDITDKIKIILNIRGKITTIELEKIN